MLKKHEDKVRKYLRAIIDWSSAMSVYDKMILGASKDDVAKRGRLIPSINVHRTHLLLALGPLTWEDAIDCDLDNMEEAISFLSTRLAEVRALKVEVEAAGYPNHKGRALAILTRCTSEAPLLLATEGNYGYSVVDSSFRPLARMFLEGLVSDADVMRLFEEEWQKDARGA
jgi:hypothetical protein